MGYVFLSKKEFISFSWQLFLGSYSSLLISRFFQPGVSEGLLGRPGSGGIGVTIAGKGLAIAVRRGSFEAFVRTAEGNKGTEGTLAITAEDSIEATLDNTLMETAPRKTLDASSTTAALRSEAVTHNAAYAATASDGASGVYVRLPSCGTQERYALHPSHGLLAPSMQLESTRALSACFRSLGAWPPLGLAGLPMILRVRWVIQADLQEALISALSRPLCCLGLLQIIWVSRLNAKKILSSSC